MFCISSVIQLSSHVLLPNVFIVHISNKYKAILSSGNLTDAIKH